MQVAPEELRLWKLTGTFTTGWKGKRRKIQFYTSTKKTEAYLNTNIYRNENVHGHPVTNFTSTNHSLHSNPIVIFMPNSLSGYRPQFPQLPDHCRARVHLFPFHSLVPVQIHFLISRICTFFRHACPHHRIQTQY